MTGITQLFSELARLSPERRRPRRVVVVLRDMEGGGSKEIHMRPFRTSLGQALREAFLETGGDPASAREGVDLRVVGLPHPRYEKAEFEEAVGQLRGLLVEEQAKGSGAAAQRQQTQVIFGFGREYLVTRRQTALASFE